MSHLLDPHYCEHYQDTPRGERLAYVAREMRRVVALGLPLLRVVLSSPDEDVLSVGVALLHSNEDPSGEQIFEPRVWRLRLLEGAVPPSRDPQGRPIAPARAGSVLVAKIGVKGRVREGASPEELAKAIDAHSGPRRAVKANAGHDLYDLVEITREPRAYALRVAILVLRSWGVGVLPDQYRAATGADGAPAQGQCQWLVEEVLDEAPAAKGRRAA